MISSILIHKKIYPHLIQVNFNKEKIGHPRIKPKSPNCRFLDLTNLSTTATREKNEKDKIKESKL